MSEIPETIEIKKTSKMSDEHREKMRIGRENYFKAKREHLEILKANMPPAFKPAANELKSAGKSPGRPKKEQMTSENAREHVVRRIFNKKEKLIDAQIDAATGLYYTAEDGKHVYMKKPDISAGEYLLNQLIGKAKENIEVKSVNLNVDI